MMMLRIPAILMVVILLMPLTISSICEWSDIEYTSELCENMPLGETEESETDKEKEIEETEKFVHQYELEFGRHSSDISNLLSACSLFASHSSDVLTPPPESICI